MSVAASTFTGVDCLSRSLRDNNDSWNAVIGGMAAGAVMGTVTKRIDLMTASAIGMGILMGVTDYAGPDTVAQPEKLRQQQYDVRPLTHVESADLHDLKEKYPKFKDC